MLLRDFRHHTARRDWFASACLAIVILWALAAEGHFGCGGNRVSLLSTFKSLPSLIATPVTKGCASLKNASFGPGAVIYVRSRLQGVNEALAPASDACMSLRARCSHIHPQSRMTSSHRSMPSRATTASPTDDAQLHRHDAPSVPDSPAQRQHIAEQFVSPAACTVVQKTFAVLEIQQAA